MNKQVEAKGIRPEEVAEVFAGEGLAALGYLAWLPHPQRAAYENLVSAAACLRDGRVIPVPGFDILFPDDPATADRETH